MILKKSDYRYDLKVVQLYLNGDREVEEWLYSQLQKLIGKMLYSMRFKGVTFADDENVISEIIYQVMVANDKKVLRAYAGECKLSTYLWRIVRNKIIDAYRRELRVKDREVLQAELRDQDFKQETRVGEVEVIIEEHISQMPPIDRFIKICKWVEGLNYNQIIARAQKVFADEVSLNEQHIAYILFTNRKTLQKKLKKYLHK